MGWEFFFGIENWIFCSIKRNSYFQYQTSLVHVCVSIQQKGIRLAITRFYEIQLVFFALNLLLEWEVSLLFDSTTPTKGSHATADEFLWNFHCQFRRYLFFIRQKFKIAQSLHKVWFVWKNIRFAQKTNAPANENLFTDRFWTSRKLHVFKFHRDRLFCSVN